MTQREHNLLSKFVHSINSYEQVASFRVKVVKSEIRIEEAKSSVKLWPFGCQSQLSWAVQMRLP